MELCNDKAWTPENDYDCTIDRWRCPGRQRCHKNRRKLQIMGCPSQGSSRNVVFVVVEIMSTGPWRCSLSRSQLRVADSPSWKNLRLQSWEKRMCHDMLMVKWKRNKGEPRPAESLGMRWRRRCRSRGRRNNGDATKSEYMKQTHVMAVFLDDVTLLDREIVDITTEGDNIWRWTQLLGYGWHG